MGAGPSGRSLMRKQGGFGTWLSLDRWVQPSAHWHSGSASPKFYSIWNSPQVSVGKSYLMCVPVC